MIQVSETKAALKAKASETKMVEPTKKFDAKGTIVTQSKVPCVPPTPSVELALQALETVQEGQETVASLKAQLQAAKLETKVALANSAKFFQGF